VSEQWRNLTLRSGAAEWYSAFVYVSARSDLRIMVRHWIVCKYRILHLILEFYSPSLLENMVGINAFSIGV